MDYTNSFMRVIDLFQGPVDTSIDTVIKPSTAKKSALKGLLKFIRTKSRLVENLPNIEDSYLVMSNKAGPNGPATVTCVQDLNALRKDPKLYYHVSEMIKMSNLKWLRMDNQPHMRGNFRHSKTAFLQDIG